MRKTEREIKDPQTVAALLQRAEYVHLCLWDGEKPYAVPVSFGYQDGALYFHGSHKGRKAECLRVCDRVAFSVVVEYSLSRQPKACDYTAHFKSVCGVGRATFVEDPAGKRRALDIVMRQYGGPEGRYTDEALGATCVVRLDVEELTGKANPPWQGDAVLDDAPEELSGEGERLSSVD